MFRNAIVRLPCPDIKEGLTTANLGKPDFEVALIQHARYVEALKKLGLQVKILEKSDRFPDSTFIEDVALCTPECAVITSPGAESRRGEINGMRQVLEEFYSIIEEVTFPGTIEGGDILHVGENYYIGISGRTNREGAAQLSKILSKYGMRTTTIQLKNLLHLKSGIAYLDNNKLLITNDLSHIAEFRQYDRIIVDAGENYAANSIWINNSILVPDGFPATREKIEKAGYKTIALDVTEFRKIDGGLSCLSLRF